MERKKVIFSISIVFILSINFIIGQGCSDAGVCTISSIKPQSNIDTIYKNHMSGGINFGKADHSISTFGMYFNYNRAINSKLSIDSKITAITHSNDNISIFGFSDIFLNAIYKFNNKTNILLGIKLPLSVASKEYDSFDLPMDFQSSLGTIDFLAGFGYVINNFQINTAIQIPLTNNLNRYIPWFHKRNYDLSTYQETNNFIRSSDVLLRLSYKLNLTDKFNIIPSILPIYHLSNDKYTETSTGKFNIVEIDGSKGLTFNTNLYLNYNVDTQNRFQLSIAAPLIVRKSRPDGLTRSILVNLDFRYSY